jgi:hypothetical protein
MIPSNNKWNGIKKASLKAEKAIGKAVNRITSRKISQTWFDSQTGPMASEMARL